MIQCIGDLGGCEGTRLEGTFALILSLVAFGFVFPFP